MSKQLFIPEKIRVGYQNREGTYTGKLAYVIYYDQKGKLRKERSWTSWCDLPDSRSGYARWNSETKKYEHDGEGIEPNDFDNVPIEGFVLNKKVGGHDNGWNHRQTYTRVFDPRGFEFEISIENLLFILAEGDCTKGKGLEGKFVYSWDGTELVLLPTHCNDYKNCKTFTDLQSKKISLRDLIPGHSYTTKDQSDYVYLGRLSKEATSNKKTKKSHVFYHSSGGSFVEFKSGNKLAVCSSNECHPDLAELIEIYDIKNNNVAFSSIGLAKIDEEEFDEYYSDRTSRFCEFNGSIYRFNIVKYTYYWEDIAVKSFNPKKHLIKLTNKFYIDDSGAFRQGAADIIVWPTEFEKPEPKLNPHYDPSRKDIYSWNRSRYENRYLSDDYRHGRSIKAVGDIELGAKVIVLTTKDGRKFTTNNKDIKYYEG